MVRTIVIMVGRVVGSPTVLDVVGVALVVAGVAALAGAWWAVITVGAASLLKAAEVEQRRGSSE